MSLGRITPHVPVMFHVAGHVQTFISSILTHTCCRQTRERMKLIQDQLFERQNLRSSDVTRTDA